MTIELIMPSNYGPDSFSLLDEEGNPVFDNNGNVIEESCGCSYSEAVGVFDSPAFVACLTEGACYTVKMTSGQSFSSGNGGWEQTYNGGTVLLLSILKIKVKQSFLLLRETRQQHHFVFHPSCTRMDVTMSTSSANIQDVQIPRHVTSMIQRGVMTSHALMTAFGGAPTVVHATS